MIPVVFSGCISSDLIKKILRNLQTWYHSKGLPMRIMNTIISKPNSSYIGRIERKQISHQNFKSMYLTRFLTKINSKTIRVTSTTRSTRLWQENGEKRWSNSNLLEVQCVDFVLSSLLQLQIFFLNPLLKLYARIGNWNTLNPTQIDTSMFILMCLLCSRSWSILQSTRWILLRILPWSWIYRET